MDLLGLLIYVVTAIGLCGLGVSCLIRPKLIGATFGLTAFPADDAMGWVVALGVRDLAVGIVALTLMFTASQTAMGWALLGFAMIPLGDMLVVIGNHGNQRVALGLHGASGVAMVIGGVLLVAT